MTETIKEAASTIQEMTSPQAVQAMLTIIVTLTVMIMLVMGRDIPEFLKGALFILLGLYFEVPNWTKKPV